MVMTSSRLSSSSLSSIASSDSSEGGGTVKFMCSYGGKILPRFPDGKLRYVGGDTRVVAVDRNVSFGELVAKMGEVSGYGTKLTIRCQIPSEDLDALVTITSDEDVTNLMEEYDIRPCSPPKAKIRAFLTQIPSSKSSSSPPPTSVNPNSNSNSNSNSGRRIPLPLCHHHQYKPQHPHHNHNQCSCCFTHASPYTSYPNQVHNGNHWQ